jgi:hypothetical protein
MNIFGYLLAQNNPTAITPFWRESRDINRHLRVTKDSRLVIGWVEHDHSGYEATAELISVNVCHRLMSLW